MLVAVWNPEHKQNNCFAIVLMLVFNVNVSLWHAANTRGQSVLHDLPFL